MDLANFVRKAGLTLVMAMLCLIAFAQGKTISGIIKIVLGSL